MRLIFEESKHIANYLERCVIEHDEINHLDYEVVSKTYKIYATVQAYWNKEHGVLVVRAWTSSSEYVEDWLDLPESRKILEFQELHAAAIRRTIELFDEYCKFSAVNLPQDTRSDNEILEEYKAKKFVSS